MQSLSAITPYSDLVLNLITKKVDLIATDNVTIVEYNKNNKEKVRQVPLGGPINLAAVSMTIPQGEHDFKSAINIANRILLGNGTIDAILNKYDPDGQMLLRVNKPYRLE